MQTNQFFSIEFKFYLILFSLSIFFDFRGEFKILKRFFKFAYLTLFFIVTVEIEHQRPEDQVLLLGICWTRTASPERHRHGHYGSVVSSGCHLSFGHRYIN